MAKSKHTVARKKKTSSKDIKPRGTARRIVQPWSTPERAYVSCLATAAYDAGKRGKELVEAVTRIVPKWRSLFVVPPSDSALINRARNSRRGPTSKTEAPEVSPRKKAIWPVAKRDYKTGKCTLPRTEKKVA